MGRNFMIIMGLLAVVAVDPAFGGGQYRCSDYQTGLCGTECSSVYDCTSGSQCCNQVLQCQLTVPEHSMGFCSNPSNGRINADYSCSSDDSCTGHPPWTRCCIDDYPQGYSNGPSPDGENICQNKEGYLLNNTMNYQDCGANAAYCQMEYGEETRCVHVATIVPCACEDSQENALGLCRNDSFQCSSDCACSIDGNCGSGYECCRPSTSAKCTCETRELFCTANDGAYCTNIPCYFHSDCSGDSTCCAPNHVCDWNPPKGDYPAMGFCFNKGTGQYDPNNGGRCFTDSDCDSTNHPGFPTCCIGRQAYSSYARPDSPGPLYCQDYQGYFRNLSCTAGGTECKAIPSSECMNLMPPCGCKPPPPANDELFCTADTNCSDIQCASHAECDGDLTCCSANHVCDPNYPTGPYKAVGFCFNTTTGQYDTNGKACFSDSQCTPENNHTGFPTCCFERQPEASDASPGHDQVCQDQHGFFRALRCTPNGGECSEIPGSKCKNLLIPCGCQTYDDRELFCTTGPGGNCSNKQCTAHVDCGGGSTCCAANHVCEINYPRSPYHAIGYCFNKDTGQYDTNGFGCFIDGHCTPENNHAGFPTCCFERQAEASDASPDNSQTYCQDAKGYFLNLHCTVNGNECDAVAGSKCKNLLIPCGCKAPVPEPKCNCTTEPIDMSSKPTPCKTDADCTNQGKNTKCCERFVKNQDIPFLVKVVKLITDTAQTVLITLGLSSPTPPFNFVVQNFCTQPV